MLYQVPLRRNASYLEREDDNTEVTQASRQKPERSTSAIQDLEATSPNLVQLEVLFLSARWSCQAVVDFLGESIKAFVFSSIAGRLRHFLHHRVRLLLSTSGDCNEINVKSLCKSSGSAFIAECLRGLGQSALEAWIEGLQQGVLTHCLLQVLEKQQTCSVLEWVQQANKVANDLRAKVIPNMDQHFEVSYGRHAGPDECQMFNPAAALLAKDRSKRRRGQVFLPT
ncbi:Phosphoinositide phospholipase C [Durusdinium trenchii]|uniref:Phosphoinositide phospholipase C n=1 Tax=Durusdinium trenchii TaxID=1381693 RepID=A0ABP0IAE8_9DINO